MNRGLRQQAPPELLTTACAKSSFRAGVLSQHTARVLPPRGLDELALGGIPRHLVDVRADGGRECLEGAAHIIFGLQLQGHWLLPAQLQNPTSQVPTVTTKRRGGLQAGTLEVRNKRAEVMLPRGQEGARRLHVEVSDLGLEFRLCSALEGSINQHTQHAELDGDCLPKTLTADLDEEGLALIEKHCF